MTANDNAALAHRKRTGQFAPNRRRCEDCRCGRRLNCPGELVRKEEAAQPQFVGVDLGGRDETAVSRIAFSAAVEDTQRAASFVGADFSAVEARVLAQQYARSYPDVQRWVRSMLGNFARGGTVTGRTSASRPAEASVPRRWQQLDLTHGITNLGGVVTREQARRQSRQQFARTNVTESEHVPSGGVEISVDFSAVRALLDNPEFTARVERQVSLSTDHIIQRLSLMSPLTADNTAASADKEKRPKHAEVTPRRPRRIVDPTSLKDKE